ncbi:MAG: HAMP domain-containing sensor histidine kinase [Clostridia bacterium]
MFEKLKRNTAIRLSVLISIVFIAILTSIFLINLFKISGDIEHQLTNVVEDKARIYKMLDTTPAFRDQYLGSNQNSLVILIKGDHYLLSNEDYFSEETINDLLNATVYQEDFQADNSRCVIDGYYITYHIDIIPDSDVKVLYLYDYTKENEQLINLMLSILGVGILGLFVITLITFKWADKSIVPIENAFNKQKELIGNASHELKTPLTIIGTNLSILNDNIDDIPKESQKWIKGINTQVKRLNNLVTEMLELAKMDSYQNNPIFENISLSEITDGVSLESEVLAFEKDIKLICDIEPNIKMRGVKANIEKLVYILVDNAIKYTNKTGEINIKVYYDKKRPCLIVRNTGEGIPQFDVDKLFDRFYRVNQSHNTDKNKDVKSFGLGLAIAKSIVDGHGGKITVDSVLNEYTEFTVLFKNYFY